jgi:hypothetical protein
MDQNIYPFLLHFFSGRHHIALFNLDHILEFEIYLCFRKAIVAGGRL